MEELLTDTTVPLAPPWFLFLALDAQVHTRLMLPPEAPIPRGCAKSRKRRDAIITAAHPHAARLTLLSSFFLSSRTVHIEVVTEGSHVAFVLSLNSLLSHLTASLL